MKKSLLIVIALVYVVIVNAQKHVATAIPVKKMSGVGQHSNTQKPGAAACDTLKYDSSSVWTPTQYSYDVLGYTFGVINLKDFDLAINENANYYDVSGSDYNYITGGLASFTIANTNKSADLSKDLVFKIYDVVGGSPGNVLGSTTVTFSQVKNDVNNNVYTEFIFSNPIPVPANKIFYVSVDLSNFVWTNSTKDSIALTANSNNEAPAAAYQYLDTLDAGASWIPVDQLWTDDLGNPLEANLFLFPYVNNTITGCSTLPVSIINFRGSINDNKALLSWSTATEFNNKGFAIERSRDGKTFTQIGFVNGAGTTTKRENYTYADLSLSDFGVATTYYRLKQIDLDGKTSYSSIIPLSLKNIVSWKLYPNPVKDKLIVELNLAADTKVNVQIISKDGRLLLNADKGTLPQGEQQLNFNIQNLASGSYFVRVKAGNKNYIQSVIKQ